MGRYAKDSGGGDFQQAPTGNHLARCVRIYDLGTQREEYEGKVSVREKLIVTWELPNEPMDDGKPFIVSRFYTNSLSSKATLRADLENWRGKTFTNEELGGFDLNSIVGKPCMISVVHTDAGKARVGGIAALPKGMQCPLAVNEAFSYWIAEHNPLIYEKISDGIKKFIEQSAEWKERLSSPVKAAGIEGLDDDIPF